MYHIRQPTDWAFYYVFSRRFLTVKDLIQTKAAAVGRLAMKQVNMNELRFCSASLPY